MRALLCSLILMLCSNASAQDSLGVGNAHQGVQGAPQREREVAIARENAAIPAGTITVTVIDRTDAPVANADVQLGVMKQGGQRERRQARTDSEGHASFTGLPTGTTQAYRVNVSHEGALYSTTPFRLGPSAGYEARIVQLPVTHDARVLLQFFGFIGLELRENRVHVTQQSRLANLGTETYVFPREGVRIDLPDGATSPQIDPVMTDQHLTIVNNGLTLTGSLPPGVVTLGWSYDVPVRGDRFDMDVPNAFRTYVHRVVTDAPTGASLQVDGFAAPETVSEDGHRMFITQVERGPEDAVLSAVKIHLRDLPGPGPVRWIAVSLGALLIVGFGLFSGLSKKKTPASAQSRHELVQAIIKLDADLAVGEVGPQFHAKARAELIDALAVLLRAQEQRN